MDAPFTRGSSWLDHVDAPLGESSEQYHVLVTEMPSGVPIDEVETANSVHLIPAATLVDWRNSGFSTLSVQIRQVGEFGVSQPISITIMV